MSLIELTRMRDNDIANAVRQWLNSTTVEGESLGTWLTGPARTDWDYTPAQLVGETVGLTIGASSDMYNVDPEQFRLFTVTQRIPDDDDYELDWTETVFDPTGYAVESGQQITFVVDHYDDPDADSVSSRLPVFEVDPTSLAPLWPEPSLTFVSKQLETRRVTALAEQVAAALMHLRDAVRELPITVDPLRGDIDVPSSGLSLFLAELDARMAQRSEILTGTNLREWPDTTSYVVGELALNAANERDRATFLRLAKAGRKTGMAFMFDAPYAVVRDRIGPIEWDFHS